MIAVVVAFITLFLTQDLNSASKGIAFFLPSIQMPEFTWMGIVTLGLLLAMLILSNDVAPGIGALESSDFDPPIRKIVSFSGIFRSLPVFSVGKV